MSKSHMIRAVLISLVLTVIDDQASNRVITATFKTAGKHELWANFSNAMDHVAELNANTTIRRKLQENNTVGSPHNSTHDIYYTLNNATDEIEKVYRSKSDLVDEKSRVGSLTTAPAAANESSDLAPVLIIQDSSSGSKNATDNTTKNEEKKPFLPSWLRRYSILLLCLLPLEYFWQIWLERLLPARGRRRALKSVPPVKSDADASPREEEIVKRWIDEGRVRSASLSWCNTFLKWCMDALIGRALFAVIEAVAEKFMRGQFKAAMQDRVYQDMLWGIGANFISMGALDYMVALIAIPAHQRLVFLKATQLGWSLLFALVLRSFVPWATHNSFVQELARNVTESIITGENPALNFDEL